MTQLMLKVHCTLCDEEIPIPIEGLDITPLVEHLRVAHPERYERRQRVLAERGIPDQWSPHGES